MISNFPEIVNITEKFIKQHGLAAQYHRRTYTGNSFGVTAARIRDPLYNGIPGLKGHSVSLSVKDRLFHAPNKHSQSSARYKGYVNPRLE